MALPDLTGQNIENTYQRVLQTDGTVIYDGTGSVFLPVSASYAVTASYAEYAVSASHEIIKEVSSSYADYAKESGLSTSSISASYALTASYALNSPDTFPYTGSAIISGSLTVTGSTEIQHLTASGLNYPTTDGGEKQLITTDSSGNLSFDWSDRTNIDVKNTSGTTLEIGTPVYISGFQGASIFQISAASSSLPGTMPAVGILDQTLNDNDQGYATLLGAVRGIDTNTPGYSTNQSLYVGEGTLTPNRPTGSALIQKIARVGSVANNGEITVLGAGRSNDIPNLQPGYAWVGDSTWNAIATPTSSFNEDPFPYTGSAVISGSLEVTGSLNINQGGVKIFLDSGSAFEVDEPDIDVGGRFKFSYSQGDPTLEVISRSSTSTIKIIDNSNNGLSLTEDGLIQRNGTKGVVVNEDDFYPNTNNNVALGRSNRQWTDIYATGIWYGDGANNLFSIGGTQRPDGKYNGGLIYLGFADDGDGNPFAGSLKNPDLNFLGIGSNNGAQNSLHNEAPVYFKVGKSGSLSINLDQGNKGMGGDNFKFYTASAMVHVEAEPSWNMDLFRGDKTVDDTRFKVDREGNTTISGSLTVNQEIDVTGDVSASTYYGDGSNLTGIETDPFPYTGSAIISGSLTVTGSISSTDTVTAVTGSFSHLKGNSPITVQDPVTFQHTQGLDVLGNATIHSINEVELQTISKDFNYTSSLNVTEITSSVNGAIIDYRLTNLNSGSRVGTFMYAHDGTELSYNDLTIPGGGIGDQPILSASLANNLVTINIENAAGFNFTGYAKKFNRLANAIPVADPNVTYLLNQYPSENVVGAYSIRQLDQFHTGSAMRIREAGSNNEIDIEFDINGYLDTLAIAAHCGSNIGYVTIWYDQSGNNNHLTQSVAGNQPKIYNGSSIYEVNGQPCLRTADASSNPVLGGVTGVDYTGGLSVYELINSAGYNTVSPSVAYTNGWAFRYGTVQATFYVGSNAVSLTSLGRTDSYQELFAGFYDNITTTAYGFRRSGQFVPSFTSGSTNATMPSTTGNQLVINKRGDYQELIIMNDYEISNREGIFTNINDYYNIYDTGLLAEYPGAAAAYSVRLLHSVYTGPSLRVREDGTDTEANIGFDSNGDLDITALLAHCGSNNGFVVTWYDQSGNGNDATQATAANQPKIVSSGVVEVENGKPIIELVQGSSSTLLLNSAITSATSHLFGVGKVGNSSNKIWIGITAGAGYLHSLLNGSGGGGVGTDLHINGAASSITTQGQVYSQFVNQTLFNTKYDLSGATQTRLGLQNGGGDSYKMYNTQEFIIYTSAQSASNRTGIETNINSYFNIYP